MSSDNDISLEIKTLKAIHKLSERFADPDAKMDTPYVVWGKKVRGYEVEDYMQDQDGKP